MPQVVQSDLSKCLPMLDVVQIKLNQRKEAQFQNDNNNKKRIVRHLSYANEKFSKEMLPICRHL